MTTQTDTRKTETPDVDIYQENDNVVILADMPGVDEKHIEVTLENDVLTLAGHTAAQEPTGVDTLYREFEAADFRRSFTIATEVDREKISATIRNGVLQVTLPKAAAAKPQKIEISAG